jgi:lipoate-protein ligase A
MIPPVCRLLPSSEANGPWNMAADEALLESAVSGRASLRFYTWSPPTLSLGYFQPEAVRHSDPRLAQLPFVRRPSGGATLVHHHEMTYALALPAGLPYQDRGGSNFWLCRMHRIINEALSGFGVPSRLCPCEEERKRGEVLCFLHHTRGDLLLGDDKIVGSAQRTRHRALLQHGSILLATSPFTPTLPGIAERTGKRLVAEEVEAAVRARFTSDTGWRLEADDWTRVERSHLEDLLAARYTNPAWNSKR